MSLLPVTLHTSAINCLNFYNKFVLVLLLDKSLSQEYYKQYHYFDVIASPLVDSLRLVYHAPVRVSYVINVNCVARVCVR